MGTVVARWIAKRRVSLALATLMLALAFVAGSLLQGPRLTLRPKLGTGLDAFLDTHNYLSPITSVFFASGPLELLLAVAALVVLGLADAFFDLRHRFSHRLPPPSAAA